MSGRRWSSLKTLPTAFVGRGAALRSLGAKLDRARVVTILGPPGTGKTRLAKEYALSILGTPWNAGGPEAKPPNGRGEASMAGGVFFVDLSEAASPDDVLLGVAQALGVDLGASPALGTLLHAIAAGAPALLILDNFEQLVRSSADVVAALVGANEATRVLVTSRERLGIPGEALFDLGPLELPAPGACSGEALELFVERARGIAGSFEPSATELGDIAALVTMLDGLPLAIELAAARTRVLRPREIMERLASRFSVLTRDASTLGRGSATLWDTIGASWVLLGADEQRALGLLSVFRGGFDVPAAERVVDTRSGAPPVLDLLQSLRDKSLLLADESDPSARRFTLLASIRDFASERLAAEDRLAGEARHAEHYLELGERLGERLAGGDVAAARRLALEHENVREVHRRFLEPARATERPEFALRAALVVAASASAFPYAFCLGLLDAGLDVLDRAPAPNGAAGTRERGRLLVRGLEARGNLRRFVGRTDDSVADFDRMRALAEALGLERETAAALSGLGNAATVRARWSEARGLFERALAIHAGGGDRRSEARTLAMLAAARFNEDAPADARGLLARALDLTRAERDRLYQGICTTSLGVVTLAVASLSEARTHLGEALRLHREGGVRHWEGVTLAYLAMVEHEAGRAAEAHALYGRAIELLHEIDVRRAEGLARMSRAALSLAEDRVADAKAELERALDLCRAMAPDHEGLLLGMLGAVAALEGDVAASDDLFACADLALAPYARQSFSAAIDAYRGLLDLARPRGASGTSLVDGARARLDRTAALAERSFEVRAARRLLATAIARAEARPSTADLKRSLVVGPSGVWFKSPRAKDNVHLHRRRSLQRIVDALALQRSSAPGEAVAIQNLVSAGWPGERVLPEAGTERVYAAVATLRKMGLKGLLLQRDDGYLFDPEVHLVRSASRT